MSKTTYTYEVTQGPSGYNWAVWEYHGGRGGVPIMGGSTPYKCVAHWLGWKNSR